MQKSITKQKQEERELINEKIKKQAIKRRGGVYKRGRKSHIVKLQESYFSQELLRETVAPKIARYLEQALLNIEEGLRSENEKLRIETSKWILEFVHKLSGKRIKMEATEDEGKIDIEFDDNRTPLDYSIEIKDEEIK